MRGGCHGCPRTDGGGKGKPKRAWFTIIGFSSERFSLPLDLVSGANLSAASLSGVDCKVRMASVLLAALTSLGSCRRVRDCDNRDAGGGVHAGGCKWQSHGKRGHRRATISAVRSRGRKAWLVHGLVASSGDGLSSGRGQGPRPSWLLQSRGWSKLAHLVEVALGDDLLDLASK